MIKSLFLIFEPMAAWGRIAQARRGISFLVAFYLAPMMLIVAAAEIFGLIVWGKPQKPLGDLKYFSFGEAVTMEALQMLLMLLAIVLCAYLIKALGETFHGRHNYTQTFTVVIYGLSPLFLLRLLDMFPSVNLWIPWVLGVLLVAKILYHGVPRVMEPDPPHAFGLFVMSTLLLALVTAAERFLSIGYLTGKYRPVTAVVMDIAHKLFGTSHGQ